MANHCRQVATQVATHSIKRSRRRIASVMIVRAYGFTVSVIINGISGALQRATDPNDTQYQIEAGEKGKKGKDLTFTTRLMPRFSRRLVRLQLIGAQTAFTR
jgi:hypothetical protein